MEVIDQHIGSLKWISDKMKIKDSLMILGDFNFPGIQWKLSTSNYLYPDVTRSSISLSGNKLIDNYSLERVSQLNFVVIDNGRLLDLCFGSIDGGANFSVMKAPSDLVKPTIHHPSLLIEIVSVSPCIFIDPVETLFYDYKNGDFCGMNNFFSNINWLDYINQNLDSSLSAFSSIVLYAIDQFIPTRSRKAPINPPWSNNHLKQLKRLKRSTLRKYTRFKTQRCKRNYHAANCRYKRLNKKLFYSHQMKVQQNLRQNPKSFWNYVNEQRKESGLLTVMFKGNIERSTTDGICDLFLNQFSSVFTTEILDESQVFLAAENVPVHSPVGDHPFIEAEAINKICSSLKASTSCGPDGIPAMVLKKCSANLSMPLSCLFNLSLQVGKFPDGWKKSYVFPVFKKGNKRDVSNYRGIAALCAVSKLFEKVVYDFLLHNCHNFISEHQHGFMPKRSTNTNLLTYTTFIAQALQEGKQVDSIYTDFSAAFDKINHQITIAKF